MTADDAPPPVRPAEARLAPVMFALGVAYLCALAGLIHRALEPEATRAEVRVMTWVVTALWPAFAVEAAVAVARRAPGVPRRAAALRALAVAVVPPLRIAWVHPATDRIWLPRVGWRPRGKDLLKTLDRGFGPPMLVFAALILPVLALESVAADQVKASPALAAGLDVAVALIWVAFALEFVVKASAAPSRLGYVKARWLDLAIVALPALQFALTHWVDWAPVARLLRLGKAVGPQQLGTMGKAYRLRGVMTKGWHAFLLLEGVARVTGATAEKRLRKVEAQIADLEDQLAELRARAEDLRKQMAGKTPT